MQARLRAIANSLSAETDPPTPTSSEREVNEFFVEDADLEIIDPLDLFCSSVDTLRHQPIDQTIPPRSGWSTRPTRMSGVGGDTAGREETRRMCRKGIPPSFKCSAWIINAVSAANPDMPKEEYDAFGTFRKVRVIDHGWDLVLKSIFPDESDLEQADVLDFGVGQYIIVNIMLQDIPDKGIRSLIKVLHAARDSLGLEFCPVLPDVACLLLSFMPESYAYATIRQMVADDSNYFLAISRVSYLAFCKTFADLMERNFPQTYEVMDQIKCLTPAGLDPIMKRFFVPLLRRKHVLRIMDIFTGEGAHAIFRIGCTLCCLAHAHLGDGVRQHCDNALMFWDGVRRFAHSKHFHFDIFLERQAYGSQVHMRILTRPIFPREDFVYRLISNNEAWASENEHHISIHAEKKPLGLVEGKYPIILAKHSLERLSLCNWLPPALQSTKLELIYSSSHHGRSIEMFYMQCSKAVHTLTLLEVLQKDVVIGMYATHTWHNNPSGYGDGECFLFRLTPEPECFKYKVNSTIQTAASLDDDSEVIVNRISDAGQLMISGDSFLSMGVCEDGASALRLNEDLTRGSTSRSISFGNQDLIGGVEVFEVGLVETYRFIREVDGQPIDKVDIWKEMFGSSLLSEGHYY